MKQKSEQRWRKLKLVKRLSFWLLVLLTLIALAFLIADFILKGSLSFFVINALIAHPFGRLLVQIGTNLIYPLMSTNHLWVNFLIFAVPVLLLILNGFVIKRLRVKESIKMLAHLVIYFCLGLYVVGFTIAQVYVDYSSRIVNIFLLADDATNLEDINSFNKIQKSVNQSKIVAQKVIDIIILEVSEDQKALSTIDTGHYMEVAETVALCFQIKGTVLSKSEHYLRNAFNRAPENLTSMLADIKAKSPYGWHLLSQFETVYHMQGKDGDYNVKFVSEDGYHEAIYNKAGDLLTEKKRPC